ncbi:hypothetical protein [Streptomyces inhibens]|uniref:hypothetical protein n=1 Tax=Streptomyces inhibens TaxID=2293571 RepID=UPI001EE6A1CA|nr:hypothetical protein [Streptomyces inhibens]UKY54565.1 hypothetical protein KI385_41015 [Streptomyces inhibens]
MPLRQGQPSPRPDLRTPAAADLCPHTGRGRLSYEHAAEYLFEQAAKLHDHPEYSTRVLREHGLDVEVEHLHVRLPRVLKTTAP